MDRGGSRPGITSPGRDGEDGEVLTPRSPAGAAACVPGPREATGAGPTTGPGHWGTQRGAGCASVPATPSHVPPVPAGRHDPGTPPGRIRPNNRIFPYV
jgi:hypothetical protein